MTETQPDLTPFVSYAQNREDVVLWRAFRDVANGRYVDVGAADPVDDSVTLALYERGWRGINIEPVPAFAAALVDARPGDVVVACGIGSESANKKLTVVEGTGLSTFCADAVEGARARAAQLPHATVSEISVPLRTLDDVLDEHLKTGDDIHLLKIDVEGLEADVIAGTDLVRWRPWVLVIESTEPNSSTPSHQKWELSVLAAGYQFCLFDGLNRFYVHQDHEELAPSLSYPACVLDAPYQPRRESELHEELAKRHTEIERCEQRVVELMAEYQRLLSMHESLATSHRVATDGVERLSEEYESLTIAHRSLAQAFSRVLDEHTHSTALYHQLATAHHELVQACATAQRDVASLQAAYDQALSSLSWRVTAPLRAVRARVPSQRDRPNEPLTLMSIDDRATGDSGTRDGPGHHQAFRRRLRQASTLLVGVDVDGRAPSSTGSEIENYAKALSSTGVDLLAAAWLSYVVATGSYPDEPTVRAERRLLRRLGPREYVGHLVELFEECVRSERASRDELDLVTGGVVVDVTHTAQHDLQTGIQRVVRETCSRWLSSHEIVPVWWDASSNGLRRLAPDDVERLRNWREHIDATSAGERPTVHVLDTEPSGIVVPWHSKFLLPELAAEPERAERYRALGCAIVIDGLSLIGYDVIPVTAAETVAEGMANVFTMYLSMVKRSQRVAAISDSAADDFRGYNAALRSQGLTGPVVGAFPLPPSPAAVDAPARASFRAKLGLRHLPLVLVVGSHEPRKNHLTVLDAAERLWSDDHQFMLLFIGGSGWRSEAFDSEVERLQSLGRPVQVSRRASEEELWAAYQVARFSVFPSLVEGYGLPIVESIASGTPVITTNYGSMAEVAEGGGAVLIDPYDSDMLADRMRRLLVDDAELERLQAEAAARRFPTWDEYAHDVWRFLVEDDIAG